MKGVKYLPVTYEQAMLVMDGYNVRLPLTHDLVLRAAALVTEFENEERAAHAIALSGYSVLDDEPVPAPAPPSRKRRPNPS